MEKSSFFSPETISLLEALEVGVFVADITGTVRYINKYFEQVTAISQAEVIGQNVQVLVDKGYITTSICKRVAQEGKTVTCIMNYKNKIDNDVIVTGKPIYDQTGNLIFIACTLRDWHQLTDLYKELQTVQEKSQEYQQMLQELTKNQFHNSEFIAYDKKSRSLLEMSARIASVDSTVLILGESGVGKDLLAKFIHERSSRALKGHFVHVNCGAIPETLFESELFGYEPGAFTGANKAGKPGLFETADNGTLFLDEIAELPLIMQAKLLTVLQSKHITRVGAVKTKKIDVRIIAATNKNLENLVAHGQFRQDLFYRLNVLPINIPSLRERKGDIPALAALFIKRLNQKYKINKKLSEKVIQVFLGYGWPGNVRELEHVIERAVVLCPDEILKPEHLPKQLICSDLASDVAGLAGVMPLKAILEQVEKTVIQEAVFKNASLEAAAKQLGVDISTLTRKKQKYGIFKKCAKSHIEDAIMHI